MRSPRRSGMEGAGGRRATVHSARMSSRIPTLCHPMGQA
jgi:hypothetical protein